MDGILSLSVNILCPSVDVLCLGATVWDTYLDEEAPLLSTLAVWEEILGHNHSQ